MYESHWKLDAKPFEDTSDPRFYYPSDAHQGALLKLRYTIENRHGGALVAGAPGLGKTLLVQTLRRHLQDQFSPLVHLVFPQMPPDQLLAYLAGELTPQADPPEVASVEQSVRKIQRILMENSEAKRHAVVVVDEAHLLKETGALETMRLLLNFEFEGRPAFTLLLVGQPSLLPALDRMPGLEERLGVKCLLRHFTLEETISYVNHRLTAAGAKQTIFEPEAVEALHHLSGGVARKINRLCDLALLIGYAEEQSMIAAAQIESVSDELVTVVPD